MNGYTNLTIITTIVLTLGCQKESNLTGSLVFTSTSIEAAKAFWTSYHITNYSLEQTTDSWYPWTGDSVRITVVADTITSVVSIRTGKSLEPGLWIQYKTVTQLFLIAQQDTGRYAISWELDPTYGYPRVLSVAPKPPPITEGGIRYMTFGFIPQWTDHARGKISPN